MSGPDDFDDDEPIDIEAKLEELFKEPEVPLDPDVKEVFDKLKGLIDKMPDPFAPPPAQPTVRAFRSASYGFPEVVLEAGKEQSAEVQVSGFFRGEKLFMTATMAEIRGHYRIRHTRRGLLNRNDVFAFSEIKRRASKRARSIPGRTVVSYQGEARSYLPENVVYIPTDALEYIQLSQLYCGVAPAMAHGAEVPAQLFGMGSFGTVLPLPSTKDASITIFLKNVGDVQVRVRAMILGYSR